MSRKLIWLGMLSLVLAPGGAMSLGLGEIRLNSYLNQPLDARIALSVSSNDDLGSLEVDLASQEAFARRGVPRPAYLNGLTFRIDRSAPGGAIIEVRSDRPIVEPFVTFLVEAQWRGGRVLREYTVLLDPPVFTAGGAGTEAPEARRVEPSQRPAQEPPAARPDPSPSPGAAASVGAEYGPVQRNETLYRIAERVRPDRSVTTNQVMLALFRTNPQAFDGNINRLRAGAILRVPPRQEFDGLAAREATAEVRRQMDAWRGQPEATERLVLTPPGDGAAPAAPTTSPGEAGAGTGAAQGELMGAVRDLRNQLEETRRLMEVKDAEIAALQQRLADLEAGAPDAAAAAPTESPAAGEEAFESEARSELTPTGAEPAPDSDATGAAPEPAVAPQTSPVAATPAQPAASPSLLDSVLGVLGSLWLWLVIGLVLVGAAGFYFLRHRDGRSIEEDLAETGTWGTLEPARTFTAAGAAEPVRARGGADGEPASMLVEESPVVPRARPAAPPDAESAEEDYRYPFEDTIAGETGINLDQSDPLAEADFHMAYGLYDQAAEIIKKAIEREPDRYDLRRKLLDICFVWGNSEEFLAQARGVQQMNKAESKADWGKVAIMGRQICPGEAMFAAGEDTEEVDVDLVSPEAAAPDVDIAAAGDEGEDWLDFDVGESAEGFGTGDTRQQPALKPDRTDQTAELNLEDLGIDLDLGETGEHALRNMADRAPELSGEEPAVEPEEESDDGTLMMEAGDFEDVSSDAPTASSERVELENEPTWIGKSDEPTLTSETADRQEDPTTEVEAVDEDLELDDLTSALKGEIDETREARAAVDEDATQLAPELPAEWARRPEPEPVDPEADTREMAPVTMSEVGTKLDLARAYIDMGDPDGARSILEEVLDEGDDAQQDEAKQLLETLG